MSVSSRGGPNENVENARTGRGPRGGGTGRGSCCPSHARDRCVANGSGSLSRPEDSRLPPIGARQHGWMAPPCRGLLRLGPRVTIAIEPVRALPHALPVHWSHQNVQTRLQLTGEAPTPDPGISSGKAGRATALDSRNNERRVRASTQYEHTYAACVAGRLASLRAFAVPVKNRCSGRAGVPPTIEADPVNADAVDGRWPVRRRRPNNEKVEDSHGQRREKIESRSSQAEEDGCGKDRRKYCSVHDGETVQIRHQSEKEITSWTPVVRPRVVSAVPPHF